jgi:hypothetical protein
VFGRQSEVNLLTKSSPRGRDNAPTPPATGGPPVLNGISGECPTFMDFAERSDILRGVFLSEYRSTERGELTLKVMAHFRGLCLHGTNPVLTEVSHFRVRCRVSSQQS